MYHLLTKPDNLRVHTTSAIKAKVIWKGIERQNIIKENYMQNIVSCEDNWTHSITYFPECEDVVIVLHFLTTTDEKTLYPYT